VITLLTDFGQTDPFVGIMKGVILGRFTGARIVDLSHAIPPQAIELGALWIELSARWFPPGTVHVVVVDPGVGSERAAVAFRADDQLFVAPDNGVCDRVLARAQRVDARRLIPARTPSATFHGRDVFAPAAADLAAGAVRFEALGIEHSYVPKLPVRESRLDPDGISGHVVWVDRFGNLVTNIDVELLRPLGEVRVAAGKRSCRVVGTYADAQVGEVVALGNSFGLLELAVREGSAELALGLGRDAPVRVERLRSG
jgi:S-adenosylmethionine hydrolase